MGLLQSCGVEAPMKDRIDPLIAERAPWLFADRPGVAMLRYLLDQLLGYPQTLKLAQALCDLPPEEVFQQMGDRLAQHVTVRGLGHLPLTGPALVVANHPTGIADGIILHHLLAPLRPDLYFYANADVLRVLPQLAPCIAPVEWRANKRTHGKTRATLDFTRAAVAQGRLGVIFPSGRLAKRRGLTLCERPWMASAAMLARRYDLPVVPIHINARNSALFYALDLIHPTLRDITLFHETLNKDHQPFAITIGPAIRGASLPNTSEAGINQLRAAVLALAAPSQTFRRRWRHPGVSQMS